jgi:hypothetical protein
MTRRANGSLRDATEAAELTCDELDRGWEEAPASMAPPPVEGVAPKVSEIRALSRDASAQAFVAPPHEAAPHESEPPSAREPESPDFRRYQIGPAVIVSAMVAAVALIVASVARSQFPRVAAPSHEIVPAPAPQETVAQAPPEPRSPAPSATATTSTFPPAPPRETPIEPAATTGVTVTVRVIPESAVIFRAGKRLGSGSIQLSIAHDAKERLTALHDGYVPSNFTLDGSRDSVTVRLQRVPSPQASATDESDSPL